MGWVHDGTLLQNPELFTQITFLSFPDFLQSQMHADDFRNDNYGVVSELRDGGYSDDMTLAAISGNAFKLLQT